MSFVNDDEFSLHDIEVSASSQYDPLTQAKHGILFEGRTTSNIWCTNGIVIHTYTHILYAENND